MAYQIFLVGIVWIANDPSMIISIFRFEPFFFQKKVDDRKRNLGDVGELHQFDGDAKDLVGLI